MDIKKLDIKKTLIAGSALAVVSGFVPHTSTTALAGTATLGVTVQVVTAITLATPVDLDFGRIAITGGGPLSGVHVLTPSNTVATTATSGNVVVAGSNGSFQITGGQGAGNVQITAGAAVSYDGGDIVLNQITLGGAGMSAPIIVAAGGTNTGSFSGGSANVNVGGRLAFSGTPANGDYNTGTISITITDLP